MQKVEIVSVAAYCRVSTEKDEQITSFEGQIRFFRTYIEQKQNWKLVEIYTDEGISGTNVKKREGFLRMIADARLGRFSLILTKEISRFARNLLDSIYYTRELKRLGVGVLFLNDGIDTRDGDAELRLAILASIAQEESRRTSQRVKWGQLRRMEQGVVFGHDMLGYDVKNGKMQINEEGAEVVRLIFRAFSDEGMTPSEIAKMLTKRGILPKKAQKWSPSVVFRILQNEKYCGDLVQKKTITTDYLSHEKHPNRGEEALVILRDHHEPIIEKTEFLRVQARFSSENEQKTRKKQSERYPLSGKLVCGICGNQMRARVQTRKNGGTYHLWRCTNGHFSHSIRNEDVLEMIQNATHYMEKECEKAKKEAFFRISRLILEKNEKATEERLLNLYLSDEMNKDEYLSAKRQYFDKKERISFINDEISTIQTNSLFFREILERIVVFENRTELRFVGSENVFAFVIQKNGRKHVVFLKEIHEKGK